ncbi:hypothetical protein CN567_30940 [Bacillus toyonensis]|uniref:hypothetical protein n=1 Tax=Bacillus toyonensis TaxID=155322 RepID=UPI000BF24507|nr:hypothetical protein [Bacillus toyonensis]PEO54094.1 hypothetical protein CN567_30940 [Bacillus toyonensis]PFX73362.1 hypothetical protein COL37_28455 [Bacillus toyonensis]PFX78276.1 hypothetical protein COL38_23500 [Bacillus toyonensis]PGA96892.1 hypothetical protein COL98_31505 [Bacillus toyonensis]
MIEVEYLNGMNLGLGYNSFTGTVHPSSALDEVNKTRPVVDATGQKVSFQVELLSNTLSLTEQLNLSASASFSYGQTASGSIKASFAQSFKQNSFTIYVLVRVHVQNQQTLLDLTAAKLSDKSALLYATDQVGFQNIYGTGFVYGILSGGDFIGILEIESKSAEEYRNIKATLSGKGMYGVMSGDASASFEQLLKSITSSYSMKAVVLRDGGEGQLQTLSPNELIQEALNFPAQVLGGKGVPFSVLVLPYNQIPHPQIVSESPQIEPDCLDRLGKIYQQFKKYQNDLLYAIDNSEMFPGIDIDAIKKRVAEVQDILDKIKFSAKSYLLDTSKCFTEFDLNLIDNSIIPKQIAPSRLGYKWYWEHEGFFGIFTRIGKSNEFEGDFRRPGEVVTSKLRTYETGNEVFIERYVSSDNHTAIYKGTISEDGKEIQVAEYPVGEDPKFMTIKIEDNDI